MKFYLLYESDFGSLVTGRGSKGFKTQYGFLSSPPTQQLRMKSKKKRKGRRRGSVVIRVAARGSSKDWSSDDGLRRSASTLGKRKREKWEDDWVVVTTESGEEQRRLWCCRWISRVVSVTTRWPEVGGGGGVVWVDIMKERKWDGGVDGGVLRRFWWWCWVALGCWKGWRWGAGVGDVEVLELVAQVLWWGKRENC